MVSQSMTTLHGGAMNAGIQTRVPERLRHETRRTLALLDAVVVFAVSAIFESGSNSRIAAALVTTALVCGAIWYCGLYRRSYAVHARDEAYYVIVAALIAAVPTLILLTRVGSVALWSIVLTLVTCTVLLCVIHLRVRRERRGGDEPVYAGITSITPGGWSDRESVASRSSKRTFDLIVAGLALALFAPIMLLAAAAIALESGRPIFFRQERIGENGRPFTMFKFRTMRTGADSAWVKPGDARVTRLGSLLRRTSIDELPQLFNVIRGEMSIVGPRPEMRAFAERFSAEIANYEQRHVVPPGITGWAQVYLKRNLDPTDVPQVLPYDLFYVEHASRTLDCAIVLKTAAEVLFHRAV